VTYLVARLVSTPNKSVVRFYPQTKDRASRMREH
jgi:hypothetical protein